MGRIASRILIAATLAAACGCGTIANLEGRETVIGMYSPPRRPPFPFGGVANDCKNMADAARLTPGHGAIFFSTIELVDFPLSLAADVVTLPWTTYQYFRENRNAKGRDQFFYALASANGDCLFNLDLISQDSFDKLTLGMPRSEVEAILGRKADANAANGADSTWGIWYGKIANIGVEFDHNDKVVRKEFTTRQESGNQ